MRNQTNTSRWITFVLSCFVVAAASIALVSTSPLGARLASLVRSNRSSNAPVSTPIRAGHPECISQSLSDGRGILDSNRSPMAQDAHWARYDNITVEVRPDGTLKVLGEQMAMDTFKSILNDQIQEQFQTRVTIRPDDDCLFRHVGPVINVCREAGIPHDMEPRPAAVPATVGPPARSELPSNSA